MKDFMNYLVVFVVGIFIFKPLFEPLILALQKLSQSLAISLLKNFRPAYKYASISGSCTIAVNKRGTEIVFAEGWGTIFRCRCEDLIAVEVSSNGTSLQTTNRGSQAVGAIVGDLLLGPAGFLIGALTGSKTTQQKLKTLSLIIFTTNLKNPNYELIFFFDEKGAAASSLPVKLAVKQLDEWRGRILSLIKTGETLQARATDAATDDIANSPARIAKNGGEPDRQGALYSTRELGGNSAKALISATGKAVSSFVYGLLVLFIWLGGFVCSVIIQAIFMGLRSESVPSIAIYILGIGPLAFWTAAKLMVREEGEAEDQITTKAKYGFAAILVLAAIAAMATNPYVRASINEPLIVQSSNLPIIVTTKNAITAGQQILKEDLTEKKWGTETPPDDAFKTIDELFRGGDVYAATSFGKNEAVLASRISRQPPPQLPVEPPSKNEPSANTSTSQNMAEHPSEPASQLAPPTQKKTKKSKTH